MERVCVIGAGAIGSLFAGHLAAVADVSVLTRREDHADGAATRRPAHQRAQRAAGDACCASADPDEIAPFDLGIVATKAAGLEGAVESLRGRFGDADDHDRAQRSRRRGGRALGRRLADHLAASRS